MRREVGSETRVRMKSKRQTHRKLLVTSETREHSPSLFFLKPGSRTQLPNPAQGLVSIASGITGTYLCSKPQYI